MAKISKEQQYRMEGISYAVRFLENGHTLDELRVDAKMRGAYNIPLNIGRTELNEFVKRMQGSLVEGIRLVSCIALRTEFGFGAKRIDKFIDAYNDRFKDMNNGMFGWDDLVYMIEKELGLEHVSL